VTEGAQIAGKPTRDPLAVDPHPLVAVTNATLTITLPPAHRAPLGVALFTVSAACWLTLLLAAHRLHHVLIARDGTNTSPKTAQRRPAPHRRV
jgi:hypothetical protein